MFLAFLYIILTGLFVELIMQYYKTNNSIHHVNNDDQIKQPSLPVTLYKTSLAAQDWLKLIKYIILGETSNMTSLITLEQLMNNNNISYDEEGDDDGSNSYIKYLDSVKYKINIKFAKYWKLAITSNYNSLLLEENIFIEFMKDIIQPYFDSKINDIVEDDEFEEDLILETFARKLYACSLFRPSVDVTLEMVKILSLICRFFLFLLYIYIL